MTNQSRIIKAFVNITEMMVEIAVEIDVESYVESAGGVDDVVVVAVEALWN